MRFSLWSLVPIIAQAECLWALASESKESGHFVNPKLGSEHVYRVGQQATLAWWLPDNYTSNSIGVVRDVNGTKDYGGWASFESTKTNRTGMVRSQWGANTDECPDWLPSHKYRFFLNTTDPAGNLDYFESGEWRLVKKSSHNGTITGSHNSTSTGNHSHTTGLSTATSTLSESASKTYNSATLTAPATATTSSDESGSLSSIQNLHKSVLALTALAGGYIILI